MKDDAYVRDSQGNIAVNTVVSEESPSAVYNYDDCFTVDSQGRRALRVVADGDSLSGNFINVSKTMPEAGLRTKGQVHIYTGTTNSNFTRGYIYECVGDTTYTDTVVFEPATISGTIITATAGALSNLCAEYITGDITSIVSGTLKYLQGGDLWLLTGKNSEGNTVGSFQVYTLDYENAGFTFTGTPEDGDIVEFTSTIEETSSNYSWERLEP